MSDIVIKAEHLSKQYRLGVIGTGTLTHDLQSWWARVRGHEDPNKRITHGSVRKHRIEKAEEEHIWALKDVSFEVKQGEVLGIIGRNGAGKSTLLKILSRVTAPTSGSVKIKGRVASLLEVGTGFHPELTGRENIYLNGAILGMTRKEIDGKFNEIVDFAEVEQFIDTPVKRYSSGMYVRLAFAVAAHLEPEILVVDEVLAVGDAAFQKKCLGKMGDVAKEGRTVLFVSHNMPAVNTLCNRVMVLNHGEKYITASSNEAILFYLSIKKCNGRVSLIDRKDRKGDGRIRFTSAWVENENNKVIDTVCSGQEINIIAEYNSDNENINGILSVAFAINGPYEEKIADLWNQSIGEVWEKIPQKGRVKCRIPKLPLNAGKFSFNICSYINNEIADWILDAIEITIIPGDFYKSGKLPSKEHGIFLLEQEWELK